MSTHLPLQFTSPGGQLTVQAPPTQTWPAGHACPQVPQLARSVCVFVQVPPQFVSPAWHVRVHWPLAQTWPAGHA